MTIVYLSSVMFVAAMLSPRLTHSGQWINPITFLCIPHFLLLVAYIVALDKGVITLELDEASISLLSLGYFAFIGGVLALAPFVGRKLNTGQINPADLEVASRTVTICSVFLSLAILDKYILILRTYGNIMSNIVQIRLDYVSGQLDYGVSNSIAFFLSALLMLNIGFLLAAGNKFIKVKTLAFCFLLLVSNDITIGGANWTFSNLCLLFCVWIATKERLGQLKFSILKTLSFLMLVGVAFVIILIMLYFRSEGGIGSDISFGDVILFYAGGDIATFGYFVNNIYPSELFGRFTFGGLYDIANSIASIFNAPFLPPLDEKDFIAYISFPSNTSIHFSHFYSDFGGSGLVVMSFLMGFLAMYVMIKYRQKMSLLRIQYFALILFVLLISIRAVPTEGKYFWFLLALLPLIPQVAKPLCFSRWIFSSHRHSSGGD